jgi:hypothetical protein
MPTVKNIVHRPFADGENRRFDLFDLSRQFLLVA